MRFILCFIATTVMATSAFPQLKVPRVYNALIKTDQNLTPSRAFPVLQPTVQRTAIGYTPPNVDPNFLATQFLPSFLENSNLAPSMYHAQPQPLGPQVLPTQQLQLLPQQFRFPPQQPQQVPQQPQHVPQQPQHVPQQPQQVPQQPPQSTAGEKHYLDRADILENHAIPLKFYPNIDTIRNEPHFYTDSGLSSYVSLTDFQNQSVMDPIPPEDKGNFIEHLLPNFQDEKMAANSGKNGVPNVPPPPVPTSAPNSQNYDGKV